jgi:6-phosphogluconolactonase
VPAKHIAYVGNYTNVEPFARGRADGIAVYEFDASSGGMALIRTALGVLNPTWLALDAGRRHLYAVNAVPEIDGRQGGAISAFAVDPTSGKLSSINRESSIGPGPCHVNVDPTGRYAIATSYPGGSVTVLPVRPDGGLGKATDFVQHAGSGPNPRRQEGPHAHSVNYSPDGKLVLVCDLGLDRVMMYRLDVATGKLAPNDPAYVTTHPGAGPRHLTFHPSGRWAYVCGEIDSTISAFEYDSAAAALRERQTISTLPAGWVGQSSTAEIRATADGRFVYCSNRGHDSIAGFAVDHQTGTLTLVGITPSLGKTPRNFTFSPDGRLLLAAHQDSDNIVVFAINSATGELTPTGVQVSSPSPVCVRIVSLG